MHSLRFLGAVCALSLIAYGHESRADYLIIDPSTLQAGPGSTVDPVQIGSSTSIQITNVSNGADNLDVPWLLILGIPNVTTTSVQITSINGTPEAINAVAQPSATMGPGQEAYTQLGLNAGTNNSNSFTNWAPPELADNNITVTSFGLFEFQIPLTLAGGGTDTFDFNSLPLGTYVIAYGQTTDNNNNQITIYDTPFTEAGMTITGGNGGGGGQNDVPEPGSLLLLGSALAGLGFVSRWRRKL